jgi:hypothetical protein
VSIEVINWALTSAPIPRNRRDASSLAVVLVGLANHADPDGRNAFPSLARLARYTRLSERSVRYALRALEELDLIRPSDPEIVAAYVKRADRRPNGYNLAIHNVDNSDDGRQSLPPVDQYEGQTVLTRGQAAPRRAARLAPETSLTIQRTRLPEGLCRPAGSAMPGPPIRSRPASCGWMLTAFVRHSARVAIRP